MNATQFESTPRWSGAPKICVAANLLAFATAGEMKTFQDSLCGSALKTWECDACGCLHYEPKYPAPAGSSSGSERRPASDLERAEVLAWMKQVKLKIKTENNQMNKPHTTLCQTATFARE